MKSKISASKKRVRDMDPRSKSMPESLQNFLRTISREELFEIAVWLDSTPFAGEIMADFVIEADPKIFEKG